MECGCGYALCRSKKKINEEMIHKKRVKCEVDHHILDGDGD